MENPTKFFRETLNEFRAADDLLSKQLKLAEDKASAQQIEATNKAEEAKRVATGYLHAIEGEHLVPPIFGDIRISPQTNSEFSILKNLAASVSEINIELEEINNRIGILKSELEKALSHEEQERQAAEHRRRQEQEEIERKRREALLREERERQAAERKRRQEQEEIERKLREALLLEERERQTQEQRQREAFLKAEAARKKRNARRVKIAVAAVCILIALHFWLLNKTTLSFELLVDGKPVSTDGIAGITLDGKQFLNGDRIGLGQHRLDIDLKNIEPFQKTFWAFYGSNNLDALHLAYSTGGVELSSEPADAEFDLSGKGLHRQGKLPTRIVDMPVGAYQLTVRRKGWELSQTVTVNRKSITTIKTEFQYGSITVTSDPTGLVISTNGVEIGKTPMSIQEAIPGQYSFTVSDGENDLTEDISVAPKKAAKHAFVFNYGAVHFSSTPTGATIIRKGKIIGKTPLTLRHVPVESAPVELRLDGYASTHFMSLVKEGITTNYVVKLFSKQYLAAMEKATQALEANEFEQARKSVALAIESDPTDSQAAALQLDIDRRAETAKQQKLEAERHAAEEKAAALAAELIAFQKLIPEEIIKNCWNKSDPYFSKLNTVDAAHNNPELVPLAAATDVIVKGIEVIALPFHKAKKVPRFNQTQFFDSYFDHSYRYYGCITNVDMIDKIVTFAYVGAAKQSYAVSARFSDAYSLTAVQLGKPIWVSGKLKTLEEVDTHDLYANRLVLVDSIVYPPDTLPQEK